MKSPAWRPTTLVRPVDDNAITNGSLAIWLPVLFAVTHADPPPPAVIEYLTRIVGWVTGILGWVAGLAFLAVGGLFLVAYFSDWGSQGTVRALAAVCIGCVLISTSSAIANAVLG